MQVVALVVQAEAEAAEAAVLVLVATVVSFFTTNS
jgi:hypothetical protein